MTMPNEVPLPWAKEVKLASDVEDLDAQTPSGKCTIAVGAFESRVVLDFGKTPICWLTMLPAQAEEIGKLLLQRARRAAQGLGG